MQVNCARVDLADCVDAALNDQLRSLLSWNGFFTFRVNDETGGVEIWDLPLRSGTL
jgi:hypothetical protein